MSISSLERCWPGTVAEVAYLPRVRHRFATVSNREASCARAAGKRAGGGIHSLHDDLLDSVGQRLLVVGHGLHIDSARA
jgi:hypothetical protein